MDVASLVKNIFSSLRPHAEEKGLDLRLQIDPDLRSRIIGDPTRMNQVITNLVSNAIKFTQKGYVLLDIEVVDQTDSQITLTIKVEDTGIGIAKEKQKIIFDQFTQADTSTSRNFGGTGLGLTICKKLLALQGTVLRLHSEPGKGSTFYYTQTFPKVIAVEQSPQKSDDLMPKEESKPLTGVSILLVEDNEVNVLVAKTFLERWGAHIDVATNGEEALQMLDTQRHRMVLMDMHMPVMDGYESTRRMRENGVTLPIVALTASLPRDVEDRVKEMRVDDIIVKPFIPEDLYRVALHYTGVHTSLK
jgi:CheY-like chemotaxis protein